MSFRTVNLDFVNCKFRLFLITFNCWYILQQLLCFKVHMVLVPILVRNILHRNLLKMNMMMMILMDWNIHTTINHCLNCSVHFLMNCSNNHRCYPKTYSNHKLNRIRKYFSNAALDFKQNDVAFSNIHYLPL